MTAIVFEDFSNEWQAMAWFFSFNGSIHGPFYTETEANHALDAYMSNFYQDE